MSIQIRIFSTSSVVRQLVLRFFFQIFLWLAWTLMCWDKNRPSNNDPSDTDVGYFCRQPSLSTELKLPADMASLTAMLMLPKLRAHASPLRRCVRISRGLCKYIVRTINKHNRWWFVMQLAPCFSKWGPARRLKRGCDARRCMSDTQFAPYLRHTF